MRSAIWKLSALATVVGVSLVTVVFLQGGLGKFQGLTTTGASAQPAASKASPGKPGAAKSTDPFAESEPGGDPLDQKGARLQPPRQIASGNGTDLGPAASAISGDDADAFASGAKTGTRARGLNFKQESAESDAVPPQLAEADESISARRRNPVGTEPALPDQGTDADPSTLEGSPPGDHAANALTNEDEDPFAKHKQKAAAGATAPRGTARRATASRSQPSIAETEAEAGNPFDQGGASNVQSEPATPAVSKSSGQSRGGSRAKLIDDGDLGGEAPINSAGTVVAGQSPDESVDDTPFPPEDRVVPAPSGKRPKLAEDGAFNEGAADEATLPATETAPPIRTSATGKPRPKIVDDEGMRESEPAVAQPNGIQPIPKLQREAESAETESDQLTPPIAKASGQRPNHLLDDGNEDPVTPRKQPASGGVNSEGVSTESDANTPDPQITETAIPVPSSKRPSRNALEIESDDAPQPTQPTAAASQSTATDVIAVPRLAATSGVPGTVATNASRARVTIEKRAPPTAYIGQPLVYQIFVRNVGGGPAQQVVVEDIVPEGVTMQGSIPQAELVGQKLSWRVGVLAAGEERKISVKIIPTAAGAVGSAATVNFVADTSFASSAEPDPVLPVPPRVSAPLANVTPVANADNGVILDLQGPKQVGLGQPFDVRFRLTNRTNQPLNNLMIRKMLPDSLQHQTGVQDLEYRVGPLAAGEVRDVTMTLTGAQSGRAISRAIVMTADARVLQSIEFAVDVGSAGQAAKNPATGAAFPVTVERLGTARPALNRPVTYSNRVTNRGSRPTGGLHITESLPLGMEFVNAGNGGQYDPATRRIYWELPRLDPNAAVELEVSVVVRDKNPQTSTIMVADNAGNQADTAAQVVANGTP